MITLFIRGRDIDATGLIPGDDITLYLNGETFLLHRHGPLCHVHVLNVLDTPLPTKGDFHANPLGSEETHEA